MRSFVVVVPHVLVEDPHKLASTQISIQSIHSRRTVLTQRSANAFARGARTDVVMTQGGKRAAADAGGGTGLAPSGQPGSITAHRASDRSDG